MNETATKTISERLKAWKKATGFTLFDIARAFNVRSITTVASWIEGKTQPTGNNLLAVERELAAWEKQAAEK